MPAPDTSKNLDILYDNLKRLYDQTADRRKTLSGQAAGLLSFTGIIQTVFLGILVTLATNSDIQKTLLLTSNHLLIVSLLGVGFVTFIITIVLALIGYFEPKWVLIPAVIHSVEMMENNKEIQDAKKLGQIWSDKFATYHSKPETIDIIAYEMNFMQGITYNKGVIKSKYRILLAAYISLAISLILLAIFGFYIISAIY